MIVSNAASIAALEKEGALTQRQAQIAGLLVKGSKPREIGEKLGVSRNAVYAQINAMKKKGVLDASYTPSGEVRTPARITGRNATKDILDFVTTPEKESNTDGDNMALPEPHMDVIRELIAQNRQLLMMLDRLTRK